MGSTRLLDREEGQNMLLRTNNNLNINTFRITLNNSFKHNIQYTLHFCYIFAQLKNVKQFTYLALN